MIKKLLKIILKIFILIAVLILVIFISNKFKTPSHERDWSEDSKILPSISISENIIEVKNIRDWRYSKDAILSKDYYDETFDLNKIEKTYYLINPFGKWNGIAHGFFLFVFEDGKSVSVSIEARRESDESFNSVKGVFNKYELWYAYGSAADFVTRRAVHYEDSELNMYPLLISKEMSQKLFLDLANETQSIEKEAKFYNTIKSNCTNLLMDSLNKAEKGSVPFHYSRLFTGYSDDYFYKLGLIPNDLSFEEINKTYRIDSGVREIDTRLGKYSKEKFWIEFSNIIKSDSPAKEQSWEEWSRFWENLPTSYKPENTDDEYTLKLDSFGVPHPSSEIKEYKNEDWGIKFDYPSNYTVHEKLDLNYIYVAYPEGVLARDGLGGLYIKTTDMNYDEFRESLNYPDPYTFIISESEVIIDERVLKNIVSSTAIGLDVETVFVESNGKNFLINRPSHPVQRKIFDSIKFL